MRIGRGFKRPLAVMLASLVAVALLPVLANAAVDTAAFCVRATTANPFTDVVADDPNIANINCLVSTGITVGVTPDTYAPNGTVTRRQMALFVKRLIDTANTLETGEPGVAALPAYSGSSAFSDVAGETPTLARAIGQLDQAGIIEGRTDGTYGPGDPVSRGAMAKFVANAVGFLTGEPLDGAGTDQFPDDDDSVFEDFIDRLGASDIVDGDGAGHYNLESPVTRRQMASFLVRPLQVLLDAGAVEPTPDLTRLVRFALQLEPVMAGGVWMLSTHTGTDQTEVVVLQEGVVPADGGLSITLPPETVAAVSTSKFFFLSALNVDPADITTGQSVDVSVGLSDDDAAGGSFTDFGVVPSKTVPVREAHDDPSQATGGQLPAEVQAALSENAAPSSPSPQEAPADNRPQAVRSSADPTPTGEPSSRESPVLVPETGVLAHQPCSEGEFCRSSSVTVPVDPECTRPLLAFNATDCIIAARDIPGVKSFRGYSHRPAGTLTNFIVEAGSEQQWQNGVRSSAGPFEVSGSTTRTSGRSTTDAFPPQGDCWRYPDPAVDFPSCSPYGRIAKFGNDTWRWERHQMKYCFLVTGDLCFVNEKEVLRHERYDGGQREDGPVEFDNYYADIEMIENGLAGSWSRHLVGAEHGFHLERGIEVERAASVGLDFPEAFSSVTFQSSMSTTQVERVLNHIKFRDDLPFFGADPFNPESGKWYRYDAGTDWGYEYWSCKYAKGWSDGSDPAACWPHG